MKKTISILLFLCVSLVGMAQDVIVKKDGSTILAKVLEVTSTEVKYKKHTNLEGPTYTVSKTEIQSINYENGEKDVFDVKEETSPVETSLLTTDNSSSQKLNDSELLNLYRRGSIDRTLNAQKIQKGKKLKKIGRIGGVVLAGVGLIAGIASAKSYGHGAYYSNGTKHEDSNYGEAFACVTLPFVGAGLIWDLGFVYAGKRMIKKYSRMQSTSIFQQEIPLGNNTMLTADVNLLNDNLTRQKTVGLGCHINF